MTEQFRRWAQSLDDPQLRRGAALAFRQFEKSVKRGRMMSLPNFVRLCQRQTGEAWNPQAVRELYQGFRQVSSPWE